MKQFSQFILKSLLILSLGVFLVSCSSGGGGDSASSPTTATGKFIDAPVSGMTYESGAVKGTTDAGGNFTYEVGKNVKFSIGDIVIGEAPALAVMTPVNLAAAGSDASTPEVVARVQLLMSLSSTDPTTTGVITITPAIQTAAIGKTVSFTSATVQENLATLSTSMGKTLVTQAAATNQLTGSILEYFSGQYAGTFVTTSGADNPSGSVFVTVHSDGTVTGNAQRIGTNLAPIIISGHLLTRVDSASKYIFVGIADSDPYKSWTGTIDADTGVFLGNWATLSNAGTFTTNRTTYYPIP